MNKRILIVITFLMLIALKTYTQVYPVSTFTQVTPPYPQSLSEFVDQMANKVNLQITVNDNTLSNYPVKLRMTIKSNALTLSTSASYITEPIYINGGEILTLNSSDLANYFRPENLDFNGYSKARYNKTGQLPDGVYQISFQVVDYARNFNISSSVPAFIYIYINDAPILNLPLNKKKIDFSPQQNIGFNWTYRHSPFTRPGLNPVYTFELWEVYPANLDPYFIVQSTEPIYREELSGTSLNYSIMHPLLLVGHTYAWRVRVSDPDGITSFKNNGYSEVYWFNYGVECIPPTIELESTGPGHINVAWETEQLQNNFNIRYRPSSQEETKWYSASSEFLSYKIDNLRPNTEYIIEVEGSCGTQASGYSDQLTATTDMNLEYQCGSANSIPEIENQERLTQLFKDTQITAGDFTVEIFRVEGENGVFNGKGFVLVPMLNFLKLEADLKNIVVNTDYQLIGGEVKTVYNLNNSLTFNFSELANSIASNTITEENEFAEIAEIKINANDSITSVVVSGKTVTIHTANGDVISESVDKGKIAAITAPNGSQYVVDGSTNTVYTQGTPSGIAPAKKSSDLLEEPEATAKYKVSFLPDENQYYGFDAPGNVVLDETYNEVYLQGKNTRIPWKSLETGRFDKITAKIEGLPSDSVFYSRESGSMVMVAPTLNDDTKQFMITGQGHKDTDELYAWYEHQPADSSKSSETFHAGSVSLVSYEKQVLNICLVSVNESVVPVASSLEKYLNDIYKQAVVDWKVSVLEGGISPTLSGGDKKTINNNDPDNLMDYTSDMKAAIKALKENVAYDKNTVYLFFADNCTDTEVKGYMPLKNQFGFIFEYKDNPAARTHTIAHELAHGAFRLRHTFSDNNQYKQSKGSTNNLLDYAGTTATHLNKYQWDYIHNPENMWFTWLMDEEEGEGRKTKDRLCEQLEEEELFSSINHFKGIERAPKILNNYSNCSFLPDIEIHYYEIALLKIFCELDISIELCLADICNGDATFGGVSFSTDYAFYASQKSTADIIIYLAQGTGFVGCPNQELTQLEDILNELVTVAYDLPIEYRRRCLIKSQLRAIVEYFDREDIFPAQNCLQTMPTIDEEDESEEEEVVEDEVLNCDISNIITYINLENKVTISWSSNSICEATLIYSIDEQLYEPVTISPSDDGSYSFEIIGGKRTSEISYIITVKNDMFETTITSETGNFQGKDALVCPGQWINIGNKNKENYTQYSYFWTEGNDNNFPEISSIGNGKGHYGFRLQNEKIIKVERTHNNKNIKDFAFVGLYTYSEQECDWAIFAIDLTPPPNSLPRIAKEDETLSVVKEKENPYGAKAYVNDAKYGFNEPTWKKDGIKGENIIPNTYNEKEVNVDTWKQESYTTDDYYAKAFGTHKNVKLRVYEENKLEIPESQVDWGNMVGIPDFCEIVTQLANTYFVIKNVGVDLSCDTYNYFWKFNAEKYGNIDVVRDCQGRASVTLSAGGGFPVFTFWKVVDVTILVNGGGGPTFTYDAYLRDDSRGPSLPPNKLSGGIVRFGLGVQLGPEWYLASAGVYIQGEVIFKFTVEDDCFLALEIEATHAEIGAKAEFLGLEKDYSYEIYEGGVLMKKRCIIKGN